MVGDALAFIEVAGHPLGVGQGSGEVDLGPWPAQTERFPRAPVPDQARGPSQRAHRCRAAVEGGAADPPPLDERDLCAQLGGVQGGGNTSGAASNDDNAHLACSSHTDAVMSTTTLMSPCLSSTAGISSATTRWTSQTGSDWAKASAAVSQSKAHFAEGNPWTDTGRTVRDESGSATM